ncbi:hypothetical protein DFS34DRAFT_619811 [Phlyctochytrium arcticum]|nr:hypothetical protein DFS34DRAFT_619811 [Phlyctochytrium arcticum]
MSGRSRGGNEPDRRGGGASGAGNQQQRSLVTFGTEQPMEISDVRAKDRNKFLPIHMQEARDEQGRKRLHGAFTGGFSAGYFNTVGSKEGWTPSTFVSSRSSRYAGGGAKPEDFMDEEDLAEAAGLNSIAATEEYDVAGGTQRDLLKRQAMQKKAADGGVEGLAGRLVADLIGPPKDSVGQKLLRQMGWREGHGVGPRAKRKRVVKQEEGEEDPYAAQFTFAPKDEGVGIVKAKMDTFGLGYNPFHSAPEFSLRPAKAQQVLEDKPKGMERRGGHGLGVFEEEEDDDVYGSGAAATTYDIMIDDDEDRLFLGQKKMPTAAKPSLPPGSDKLCEDGRPPLPGFTISQTPLPTPKWFPPPPLPTDFIPFHTFTDTIAPSSRDTQQQLNAEARRDILGETALNAPARSVFAYLPIKEQDRLQAFISRATTKSEPDVHKVEKVALRGVVTVEKDTAVAALKGFMPFGNEPMKQTRYRRFLEVKAGLAKEYIPSPSDQSKQDAAHEIVEFSKAALIFKPLSGMMASRFVTSSEQTSLPQADDKKDVAGDAAKLSLYGRLTRSRETWHPDKLLCKRFNVPDPHTDKKRKRGNEEDEEVFRQSEKERAEQRERDRLGEKQVLNSRAMGALFAERDRLVYEGRLGDPNGEDGLVRRGDKDMLGRAQGVGNARTLTSYADVEAMKKEEDAMTIKVKEEENDVKEEYEQRPPMDIFKAIFADSDDDDSDSEDEVPPPAVPLPPVLAAKPTSIPPVPVTLPPPPPSTEPEDDYMTRLPPPTFRPLFRKRADRGKAKEPVVKVEEEKVDDGAIIPSSETALATTLPPPPPPRHNETTTTPIAPLVSPTHSENENEEEPPTFTPSTLKVHKKLKRKKSKRTEEKKKRKRRRESSEESDVWVEKPVVVVMEDEPEKKRAGVEEEGVPPETRVRRGRPSAADFL